MRSIYRIYPVSNDFLIKAAKAKANEDWSTSTQLKIGKKKKKNKIMKTVEHAKISLQFNVIQRGDIIAPVYFSVTFEFYCYLLKTFILTCGSIPHVGHMQTLWHPRSRFLNMVCWRVK